MATAKKTSIYSMLSNDQNFVVFEKGDGVKAQKVKKGVLINGRANVPDKHRVKTKYVETQVSADDAELLKSIPQFKRLLDGGYLSLTEPTTTKKDKSAPATEADVKKVAPKVEVSTDESESE